MPIAATQRSYDIEPGTDINDNAGFIPLSVLVDNYSPYWLLLPDAGRYVPPYTSGAVLPLIHAQTNRASWSQPPLSGLSTGTGYVTTAGFAHLTFVGEQLAYVAGSSVPNSVLSQQASLTATEGGTINASLNFLAQGVRIDNPGGTAYTIVGTGLVIPPWTTAWLANFTTPFNTATIQPITNPNGVANTTDGGPIVATFYAQQVVPNGGTNYVQPTVTPGFIQAGHNALSYNVTTITVSLPNPATKGDLLIIAFEAYFGTGTTVATPPGFTTITQSFGTNGIGYWVGYDIANGGETSFTFSVSGGSNPSALVAAVAEYGPFANSIAQTANASSANTVSVTPVTSPNKLVGISLKFNTTSTALGTTLSPNLVLDDQYLFSYNTGRYGIQFGSLYYTTNTSETATITWGSGTANLTVAIACE